MARLLWLGRGFLHAAGGAPASAGDHCDGALPAAPAAAGASMAGEVVPRLDLLEAGVLQQGVDRLRLGEAVLDDEPAAGPQMAGRAGDDGRDRTEPVASRRQ